MTQDFKKTLMQIEATKLMASNAKHIMLEGGSRCVSGDTIINGQTKTIKELADEGNPIKVLTSIGYQMANPPFKKGESELIKITTECDNSIKVTSDHRFWNGEKWLMAKDLSYGDSVAVLGCTFSENLPQSISGSCLLRFASNVLRLNKKPLNLKGGYSLNHHQYDQQLLHSRVFFLAFRALLFYVLERNRSCRHEYLLLLNSQMAHPEKLEQVYIHCDQKLFHLSNSGDFPELYQLFLSEFPFFLQIYELFQDYSQRSRLDLGKFYLPELAELAYHNFLDLFFLSSHCDKIPLDAPENGLYSLSKISLIDKLEKQKFYTINVPITEQYFANNFLNHNSGKTFIEVRNILIRASKVTSRHVSLRRTFNSIKTSIFMDTLPKVHRLCFPNLKLHYDKTNYRVVLPNGSEYWIAGLDNPQHMEKILGKEYSTMHFNECSEIDHDAVTLALTRLAEKNILKKKVYYDQNPPQKSHWTYWQFRKLLNPLDNVPIKDPHNYKFMVMNPMDNIENIDSEYLDFLKSLPEDKQARFLRGEYQDNSDGQVYHAFDRDKHVKIVNPMRNATIFIGMDFNVDPMTAVVFQIVDDQVQVFDEVFLNNSDTLRMSIALKGKGYIGAHVIPDSTGANRKTSGATDFHILRDNGFMIVQTRNPYVGDRVNNVNRLLAADQIIIDPKCEKLINDLEKVSWKNGELDQRGVNKHLTHISDALGYGCYSKMPMIKPKLSPATSGRGM